MPTSKGPMMSRLPAIDSSTIRRIDGQFQTNEMPSRIWATIEPAAAVAWAAPPRISHRVTSETTNEAASISRAMPMPWALGWPVAAAVPNTAMSTPASAGPRKTVSWPVPWTMALAWPSCSPGATAGTIAVTAGKKNASAMPKTSANK